MTGLKVSSFEKRICELLDNLPGSDSEKGKALGVSRQTISAWKTGVRSPREPMIMHIASVFKVSLKWLMGFDVPMHEGTAPNILPITPRRIPMLGTIACGEPIFAEEDFTVTVAVGAGIDCDFALRCSGDSMKNARILDGDIVFIKKQDTVEDGEIAAVLIDDDATLKRVRRLPGGMLMLSPENPAYQPIFIGGENETRVVRILGKAVAFQSSVV